MVPTTLCVMGRVIPEDIHCVLGWPWKSFNLQSESVGVSGAEAKPEPKQKGAEAGKLRAERMVAYEDKLDKEEIENYLSDAPRDEYYVSCVVREKLFGEDLQKFQPQRDLL
eukprot:gene18374-20224_t